MEIHDEYEEKEGSQPFRGHSPIAAVFLFGSLFAAGLAALFGGAALQRHLLTSELEESKKTVIYDNEMTDRERRRTEAYSRAYQRMESENR